MASDIVFDNAVVVSHDSYRKGYSSKLNDFNGILKILFQIFRGYCFL